MSAPAVVVRWYAGDGVRHCYRADDMDTLDHRGAITPVCQEDRFYPVRHDPEVISDHDLPDPGHTEGCPGCAVWARHNRHTVRIRGRVPSPRPCSPRSPAGVGAPDPAPAGLHGRA